MSAVNRLGHHLINQGVTFRRFPVRAHFKRRSGRTYLAGEECYGTGQTRLLYDLGWSYNSETGEEIVIEGRSAKLAKKRKHRIGVIDGCLVVGEIETKTRKTI